MLETVHIAYMCMQYVQLCTVICTHSAIPLVTTSTRHIDIDVVAVQKVTSMVTKKFIPLGLKSDAA